jgi:hypothetical protein
MSQASDLDPLDHAEALQAILRRNEELEQYVQHNRARTTIVNMILIGMALGLLALVVLGFLLLRNDNRGEARDERTKAVTEYIVNLSEQQQCQNRVEYRSLLARQQFFIGIAHALVREPGTAFNPAEVTKALGALEASNNEAKQIAEERQCPPPEAPNLRSIK